LNRTITDARLVLIESGNRSYLQFGKNDGTPEYKGIWPNTYLYIGQTLEARKKNTSDLNLEDLHLPTGWITVEEIIRFLICDFGVRPKSKNWDVILQNSEDLFKKWTAMRI
jgi:hypothetical protein